MSVETTTGEETKIEETKAEPKAKTKAKKSRKEKKAEAATAAEARHTEKCPACGAIRAEGAATCPDCGFEYGGPPPVIESLSVDPATIREGENSRCVAEANYLDTVQARALDIFVNGQIAPCECRRDETGLVLVSGFTRKAAVELIRTGFTAVHPINGGEPQFFCDPSRLLRVQVVNVTPEQAFLRGIKENIVAICVDTVKAQIAATAEDAERSALLATRPDLDAATKKLLASESPAKIRAWLSTLPVVPGRAAKLAASANVTGTQGDSTASGSMTLDQANAALGIATTEATGIRREGLKTVYPAMTPTEARAHLAARDGGAR